MRHVGTNCDLKTLLLNIVNEKTAVYHTVNGDPALLQTSETAKIIKVITNFIIFAVFDVCNNAGSPLTL